MKKTLCVLLAAMLLILIPAGCAAQTRSRFTADNEIFTYQKIDEEKTQLVVARTGNVPVELLCHAFEAANPDIQVIFLDITGGNSNYIPLTDWVAHGSLPDVLISAASFFDKDMTLGHFENFSADPIIQNYQTAALQRTSTEGEVYWLPGPSDISAMMYNKTLFDKYGWEVPSTFDEFVALCDRITEDTDGAVQPWNPNAKYDRELLIALEAITYGEIFSGVDNRSWYNAFTEEKESFAGHMDPYMEVIETLAEHGILKEEHFSYSATTRGKEFAAGDIAMININIYDVNSDEFEFGYMPFPSTDGEMGYVSDSYSCFVGVPIKERTDKEQEAVHRFVEYFSSPEGQLAYMGNSMKVSNVKDVPLNQSAELGALASAIDAGHMFAALDFGSASGKRCNFSLHQVALDIVTGKATGAECIALIDEQPYIAPDTAVAEPAVLATAEDMTILETSFYMADMYREKAEADVGLIANNAAHRGNLMKFFAGDVTDNMVTVFKPRSFANDSTLVKLSMTGQQIIDAMDAPLGDGKTVDCIYAFSGLKCEMAPWNELGSKCISVKLADGSELEPDKLYTVAAWAGTVAEEYITETLETYEGTWEELMTAKLLADGTVAPAKDGRIKLIWK